MKTMTLGLSVVLLVAVLAPRQLAAQTAPPEAAADGKNVAAGSRHDESFRDCADCPEMVVIPAGEFTMGAPAGEMGRYDEEGPQRRVQVRRFAASKFDVTRGQWALFVAAANHATQGGCSWSGLPGGEPDAPNPAASWRNLGFAQENSHPVVCVTWNDAQDYLNWLSGRTGHPYRLLTEAEWEYAARAGSTTPYPWGESASHEHANYGEIGRAQV